MTFTPWRGCRDVAKGGEGADDVVDGVEICALTGPIVRAHEQNPYASDYEIAEAHFVHIHARMVKMGWRRLRSAERKRRGE
jgi:hypothetical protein